MDTNEARFKEILEELGITDYIQREHEALFSAEQEGAEDLQFPGLNLKNLLVRDKKNEDFYMVILDDYRRMDQKHFRKVAGWSNKNRFATEEEMWDLLKLKPGSVTPYALFNDVDKKITVVLANEIVTADSEQWINLHPCRNTATISIHKKDFYRILEKLGNPIIEELSTEDPE